MRTETESLLLLAHICLALVWTVLICLGKTHLRKEHIIFLYLIPVIGILVALTIEFIILLGKQGNRNPDLEGLTLDHEILWTTLRGSREKSDLVPLEEAVLINDVKVRRKLMLDILYADPSKYLNVLNVARYNEDVETSHYATTTISKAQKDFQISVQKYALELESHPNSPGLLDAYVELLRNYIQSGLLEDHLLKSIRIEFSKALDAKLAITKKDRNTLVEKLRNAIELDDYASAFETSDLLKEYWPEDEQTWIEALRVCIEGKNGARLKKVIEEIQHKDVVWTEQGRQQVRPWLTTMTQ